MAKRPRKCRYCGGYFTPLRSTAKYCKTQCRKKANNPKTKPKNKGSNSRASLVSGVSHFNLSPNSNRLPPYLTNLSSNFNKLPTIIRVNPHPKISPKKRDAKDFEFYTHFSTSKLGIWYLSQLRRAGNILVIKPDEIEADLNYFLTLDTGYELINNGRHRTEHRKYERRHIFPCKVPTPSRYIYSYLSRHNIGIGSVEGNRLTGQTYDFEMHKQMYGFIHSQNPYYFPIEDRICFTLPANTDNFFFIKTDRPTLICHKINLLTKGAFYRWLLKQGFIPPQTASKEHTEPSKDINNLIPHLEHINPSRVSYDFIRKEPELASKHTTHKPKPKKKPKPNPNRAITREDYKEKNRQQRMNPYNIQPHWSEAYLDDDICPF